jgi:hypothetical protein
MLDRCEEEGAKASTLAFDVTEPSFREKAGEEFLGQVLGVMRAVSLPTNESIEWIPIGLAKLGECRVGTRCIASSGENDAPTSGSEMLCRGPMGWCWSP